MGEHFYQRYPNGQPMQNPPMQPGSQLGYGPSKPTLINGLPGSGHQAHTYTQQQPTSIPSSSFPNAPRPAPHAPTVNSSYGLEAKQSIYQQSQLQQQPQPRLPPSVQSTQIMGTGPTPTAYGQQISRPASQPSLNSSYNGIQTHPAAVRPPQSMVTAGLPPPPRPVHPGYGYGGPPPTGAPTAALRPSTTPNNNQLPASYSGPSTPSHPPMGASALNPPVLGASNPPGPLTPGISHPPMPNAPMHASPSSVPPLSPPAPQPPGPNYPSQYPLSQPGLVQGMERMSVTQQGFNKLWGSDNVDLLQCRNILPPTKVVPPPIRLTHEFMNSVNCSQEIFCCTLNKIPETNNLLQKSRLPLGVLIHPFRDLTELPVIQCSSIVRCRSCRTYINPFVYFVDNKRWKCNLCFRVNELPDEFQFDPVSRTYGDPSRRPEIKSCTIEFIAPSEYMLRPPQPAIYLFLLEVSRWGCDSGYLTTVCDTLAEELDSLPGDARTQVGFILYDSYLHYFSIPDGASQARELIMTDIDDVFLPMPDSLLVNLQENKNAIQELLSELPQRFAHSFDTGCALGPALQAAHKLMVPTGGRVTIFQASLPNKGPGALTPRDTSGDSDKDSVRLNPQTDFYKRLALDCSTHQIAVDVFLLNSQYADLATVAGISQFSGGCVHHLPGFRVESVEMNERLTRSFRRYLTRKIGFEAVMRVRCSRGLAIHTFHGNFFVRSTDLLSLPNVNPDAGFGMQVTIEDSLSELHSVCFQAALLYTSSKGERRIRVHTVCLPTSANLPEIMTSANQQAIIGLLSKMAVDRSLKSNLSDAREAFINASVDILSTYKSIDGSHGSGLVVPNNLALIPLYILALLKSVAFRSGHVRLDDRMFSMLQMKNLPLRELIQSIHPDLYHVTTLDDEPDGLGQVSTPARLGLSLQYVDSRGAYIIDLPEMIYLLVGENVAPSFLQNVLGVTDVRALGADITDLPDVDRSSENNRLRAFVNQLQLEKSYPSVLKILTEQRQYANMFVNDKSENALSYHELLNHIKTQVK